MRLPASSLIPALLQVLGEVQMAAGGKALTMGGNMQVGHVAHLAGAAVGVLLVLLVARLPEVGSGGADD